MIYSVVEIDHYMYKMFVNDFFKFFYMHSKLRLLRGHYTISNYLSPYNTARLFQGK